TRTGPFAPVSDAWAQSGRILGESAGTALRVAVASLPWIPLVLIVFLILRALWRLRRRRRARPPRLQVEE
ncbi:hypothetical protein, partial [Escherichia coli]